MLLEDNYIEWQGSLKATYEKYLGTYNIDRDNEKIWDLINEHKIISLFQFEKSSGYTAIEMGKPRNIVELTALNSVMRLMAQPDQTETPLETYSKHRNDINTWYQEMDEFGLTKNEQEFVKKYALETYGLLPSQESFMIIVQDEAVGGWDLIFADKIRKAVAKKQPKDFKELEAKFFERAEERNLSLTLCSYVWKLIAQNAGYSFNNSHVGAYTIIGLQEANLAYYYPIIYWNCANLISDSGGEDSTVKYDKIAAAVGRVRKEGISIIPPYINRARFDFRPDAEKNEIVYGLKPISGLGGSIAQAIVANQPYKSIDDFQEKMQTYKESSEEAKFGDTAMIQLIKSGAFDELENMPREQIMENFIRKISKPIKSVSLSNIEEINSLGLLTDEEKAKELRLYRYRNYVFKKSNFVSQDGKSASTAFYRLDNKYAKPFFYQYFEEDMTEGKDYKYINDMMVVKRGSFDRVFEKLMSSFKQKINSDEKYIKAINDKRFEEIWNEKCPGSISKWEMDSMNYYYHEHELANINRKKYMVVNFDDLPEEPEIADMYFYRGQQKARFKLSRLVGTVIGKDKNHNTISLLSLDGVVTVRFYSGQFSFYDREISQVNEDGAKTKIEGSWFKRGTKLLITGYRNGEQFIPKKYSDSIYRHTVQLILDMDENGILSLQSERAGLEREEDMVRV